MDKDSRSSFIRKHITSVQIKKTNLSDIKANQPNNPKHKPQRKCFNADKENLVAIENISHQIPTNKSPRNTKKTPSQLQIRSPDRPVYMPSGFRSNKAQQCIIDIDQQIKKTNQITTIYSGISKDGKYQILSKAFTGKELQKATSHQIKTNNKFRQKQQNQYLSDKQLPFVEQSKVSCKQNGVVKSYAVNTHQGIARNYNQDRVSIILNINKKGIKSTFFAVYDGHGGTGCCDFLRDYLHQYIINHNSFPEDPKTAIIEGVHRTQSKFIQLVKKKFIKTKQLDRSGSCGIIVLIVEKQCYVVNVGDSRAFLSKNNGKIISHLSKDHKPTQKRQQKRIIQNGGKIYRTEMTRIDKLNIEDKSTLSEQQFIIGPLRVFPGKLSVTKTFGDIEAKDRDFNGIPDCISHEPQISNFTIGQKDNFLFLGCDGIFQKLESVQVSKIIWKVVKQNPNQSVHKLTGKCVDQVIKQSMRRKSTDNLTAIMINLKEDFNLSPNEEPSLIKNTSCTSL